MEAVAIFHVIAVTILFAIFQAKINTGQHVCPLQCQCDDSNAKRGMYVTCVEPSFIELPIFPRSTMYIKIKGKSKVSKIYNGALSGLNELQTFNLDTDVTWKFESGVFHNLASLKFLNLQSYVPNTLPADVLHGLTLQKLKLNLQGTALPYDSICSQQKILWLHLGDNNMDKLTLPKCVSNMTVLSSLLLNSNKFTSLCHADFAYLENSVLKELSLSDCRIADVHEDTVHEDTSAAHYYHIYGWQQNQSPSAERF